MSEPLRRPDPVCSVSDCPRISSLGFRNRHLFLLERFGEAGLEAVVRRLPPDIAAEMESATSASIEWHPLTHIITIDRAIVDTHFGGDISKATEMGIFSLEQGVKGVFRFFFRFLDPWTIASHFQPVFSKLADRGQFVAEQVSAREVLVRYRDFNPIDPIYCHFLRGAIIGAIRACKVQTLSVEHIQCRLRGASECVNRSTWE